MLTIRAMVKIGPWTIESIHRNSAGQNCDRCNTKHKIVWTCTVDPANQETPYPNGKSQWEIGSTCGPTLIDVSDQVWKEATKEPLRRHKLLEQLDRLIIVAEENSHSLPKHLIDYRPSLIDGTISERSKRHIGNLMASHERKLGMRK